MYIRLISSSLREFEKWFIYILKILTEIVKELWLFNNNFDEQIWGEKQFI